MLGLDFEKTGGLIPAVVQDAGDGRILMVGFMNELAFEKTIETGKVTFWSRTRNALWTKGVSSGHYLAVKEIQTDCDADTLVIQGGIVGPRRLPQRLSLLLLPTVRRRPLGHFRGAHI